MKMADKITRMANEITGMADESLRMVYLNHCSERDTVAAR